MKYQIMYYVSFIMFYLRINSGINGAYCNFGFWSYEQKALALYPGGHSYLFPINPAINPAIDLQIIRFISLSLDGNWK